MQIVENFQITTDRLILRLISLEYRDDIFREFTEEVARFLFSKPSGKIIDTETFITKSRAESLAGNNLQLVSLDRESGEFMGCLGVHKIREGRPELGLWFKKSVWGRGYGKEAMLALKEWAKDNLTSDTLCYPIYQENIASQKIAQFLGGTLKEDRLAQNCRGRNLKKRFI